MFILIDTKGRRLAVETHLQSRVYLHSAKLTKSFAAEALMMMMIRIIIIIIIILIIIDPDNQKLLTLLLLLLLSPPPTKAAALSFRQTRLTPEGEQMKQA